MEDLLSARTYDTLVGLATMQRRENINNRFKDAVHAGDEERLRQLIHSYGFPHGRALQYSLLCESLKNEHDDLVKLLLTNSSICVNSENTESSNTPLHFAVKHGDTEIIEMLLKRGAKITATNIRHETPLQSAIITKKIKVAELLVKQAADFNEKDASGNYPLHLAAQSGYKELVQLLVDRGADINARSKDDSTPLCIAAESGHEQIFQILLNKGAEITATNARQQTTIEKHSTDIHGRDSFGYTPLHLAAQAGFKETVQILLSRDADTAACTWDSYSSPLHLAAENGHVEIVEILLEGGAKVDALAIFGETPLHKTKKVEIAELLLNFEADVNMTNFERKSPLHLAAEAGYEELVELFLERGADANARTWDYYSTLSFSGDWPTIERLLGEGAKISAAKYVRKKGIKVTESVTCKFLKHGTIAYLQDTQKQKLSKYFEAVLADEKTIIMLHTSGVDLRNCRLSRRSRTEFSVMRCVWCHGLERNIDDDKGMTALHLSARNGHQEVSTLLLNNGATVDTQTKDGWTALHLATIGNYSKVVRLLLESGASVDAPTLDGITPLHVAVEESHLEIIETLLKSRANINYKDKWSRTALHRAAQQKLVKVVETILKFGARVNSKDKDGRTALQTAIGNAYCFGTEIVETILKAGADVNARDKDGRTAFHIATEMLSAEVVELVFRFGTENCSDSKFTRRAQNRNRAAVEKKLINVVDTILKFSPNINCVDKAGRSALHVSAGAGNAALVDKIFKLGGDIHLRDNDGRTALHYACESASYQVVETILRLGTDINVMDNDGRTAIFVALQEKNAEAAAAIIRVGGYVNSRDENGRTALHVAAEKGNSEAVAAIVKLGVNVNSRDKDGRTALHVAAENGNSEAAETIFKLGGDLNARDRDGKTALHLAVASQCSAEVVANILQLGSVVIELKDKMGRTAVNLALDWKNLKTATTLFKYGGDVNSRDRAGRTALHQAVEDESNADIEEILKFKVDINLKDKMGRTPLHTAAERGNWKAAVSILKLGGDVNSRDNHGKTALHLAAGHGRFSLVLALLDFDADINITNKSNHTPVQCALSQAHHRDWECSYPDNFGIATVDKLRTARVLQSYVILKMQVADFVSNKNVIAMNNARKTNWREFQDNCIKEVASMQKEKIKKFEISINDILLKNSHSLEILMRNENVVQALKFDDYTYRKKFPTYSSMIKGQIRKGVERKELLEQAHEYFNLIGSAKFPFYCTEEIASYLSNSALQNFINAFTRSVSTTPCKMTVVLMSFPKR